MNSNTVCEGVQTSDGKDDVLSHSVHAWIHLFRDDVQPKMTLDDWSLAQDKDLIINQIVVLTLSVSTHSSYLENIGKEPWKAVMTSLWSW